MTISTGTIIILVVGALVLSVLAVVLDRVNFPQKPFRPKQIVTDGGRVSRDRTGAHILDDEPAETSPGIAGPNASPEIAAERNQLPSPSTGTSPEIAGTSGTNNRV